MLTKLMRKIGKGQAGITGLETAIILIAFVVVAAVFAYTVLSAGIFSSQKSQEAVYSGLDSTQSTLEVKGSMLAECLAELDDANSWINNETTQITMTGDATNEQEGIACLSLTIGTAASLTDGQAMVYRKLDKIADLSGDTDIYLDMYSSGTLTDDATLRLVVSEDGGSTWEDYAPITTDLNAATWTAVTATFNNASGSRNAVNAVGVYLVDKSNLADAQVIRVDNIKGYQSERMVDDCDSVWIPNTNVTVNGDSSTKHEGTSSSAITVAAGFTTGTIAYHPMTARNVSTSGVITLWLKTSTDVSSLADTAIELVLSSNIDLSTEEEHIDIAASNFDAEWHKIEATLANTGSDTAIQSIGLKATADPGAVTFYIDAVESHPDLSLSKPMKTYTDTAVFTLAQSMDAGQLIDFTPPTDTNSDGIIDAKDATQNNVVVVSYTDDYQQVSNLPWSKTLVGQGDADDIMETREKFAISVDLSYINDNAVYDYKKVGVDNKVTIEVKTPSGATLVLDRTMPTKMTRITTLN